MKKHQKGFSLSSLIYWGVALCVVGLLAAKVVPTIIEYQKTVAAVKKTVEKIPKGASLSEIRIAYARFAEIDSLDLKHTDIEISNEGGQTVISFAYDKKIPLFGPASLLIEYRGSSSGK